MSSGRADENLVGAGNASLRRSGQENLQLRSPARKEQTVSRGGLLLQRMAPAA